MSIYLNLLPEEIVQERQKSKKVIIITKISIILLLSLIFFSSITFALRFAQRIELGTIKENLAQASDKVNSLQGKEAQVLTIKQRLSSIQTLSQGDSKLKDLFDVILVSLPSSLQVDDINVNKAGVFSLSLSSPNLTAVETFFSTLESHNKNLGLISKIEMDGFSLGKDGVYRFTVKISSK